MALLDDYLAPLPAGRDADDLEDIHRLIVNSAYWRGGSIAANALGGIDVALWDLKAKRLGAPLHSLFGGRVRAHAEACTHVDGRDAAEIAARHPVPEPLAHDRWALLRNTDGSVQRP
jgi:mannonate dehydratase